MKFSQKCVWNAVYQIIPNYKIANDGGVNLNLPSSLKDAAALAFCSNYDAHSPDDRNQYNTACEIIRVALNELNKEGCFNFGDCN